LTTKLFSETQPVIFRESRAFLGIGATLGLGAGMAPAIVTGGTFLSHPEQCAVTIEPKADHPLAAGVKAFTVARAGAAKERDFPEVKGKFRQKFRRKTTGNVFHSATAAVGMCVNLATACERERTCNFS
jgi:hypothetical protein